MLTDEETEKINQAKYKDDSKRGFMLEVDIEYPHTLHDKHYEYPPAPERFQIDDNMLSEYCKLIKKI